MYNPQLETFLRVADAVSFNKAAEESHITSTAVIKQINLLEESLGLKLFERTHRGLHLTKAGKSLYQDSKYIIQYCKDSVTRAKNAMQEDSNVIRIGTSPITPAQLLMQLWPKIQEQCPDIKFQIIPFENTPENAREILRNLGKNIDVVGGIFDETMLDLRSCAGLELSREPLCCAVSVHHPLAAKDKLKIEDLYGENLFLMHRGWSRYVDKLRDDLWKNHSQIHIIDFDFCKFGMKSIDIYNYMIKVIKNYAYKKEVVINIINDYSSILDISNKEKNVIFALLNYPKDFINIAKDYYLKQKSWDEEVFVSRFKEKIENDIFRSELLRNINENLE